MRLNTSVDMFFSWPITSSTTVFSVDCSGRVVDLFAYLSLSLVLSSSEIVNPNQIQQPHFSSQVNSDLVHALQEFRPPFNMSFLQQDIQARMNDHVKYALAYG